MFAMAGASVPEIATMTWRSLSDMQKFLDKSYIHRDERLPDAGVDKMVATLTAMAAVSNDIVINGERESSQPKGLIGRRKAERSKDGEAASNPV
jgi:hypothetical protein